MPDTSTLAVPIARSPIAIPVPPLLAELGVLADADGAVATAVDLTHGRALMPMTGHDAARALATLCAIDLDAAATPEGYAFRTSVAKIAAAVVRDDVGAGTGEPSYLLHCERSSGQYVFDCLLDAGSEFGVEPAGSDLHGKGA